MHFEIYDLSHYIYAWIGEMTAKSMITSGGWMEGSEPANERVLELKEP